MLHAMKRHIIRGLGATAAVTAALIGSGAAAPVAAVTPVDPAPVSAGEVHVVAYGDDGSLWAWGKNSFAQFGNGSMSRTATDEPVETGTGLPENTRVSDAASGAYATTVVVTEAGNVYWAGLPPP